jgi:hypothetical protein
MCIGNLIITEFHIDFPCKNDIILRIIDIDKTNTTTVNSKAWLQLATTSQQELLLL